MKIRTLLSCLLLGCLLSPSVFAYIAYRAPMDEAVWETDLSVFGCRLSQPIPIYGEAVFWQRAGEELNFTLKSSPSPMKKGKAVLVSDAPEWYPGKKLQHIGKVPVSASNTPVRLKKKLATRLLAELEKGMAPRFTRMSWFSEGEMVDVSLSSVNFRAAYRQYQACLASLLPVNFDQIRRTRLHFATNKSDIIPASKRKLDLIMQYAKADPAVNAFYVDGHTDNVAERLYNYELSQRRAEAVSRYLTKNGVSMDMITMRYHGERYPVAKNNTAKNRAKNRRVTIRLEKE